jgi:pimeloyl-ACP methyl ester carboxylesterase
MPRSLARTSRLVTLILGLGLGLGSQAAEVKIPYGGLTLNANLELADGKTVADGAVLITHGTLAHNGMEIIQSLQGLLKDRGLSSLAINLSLGLSDRHGMYDCKVPHTHRHADAAAEIGAWVQWLRQQGAQRVVLLGHSRGGDQTAWYASEKPDPTVTAVVLVAPMVQDAEDITTGYRKSFNKELTPIVDRARDMVAKGQGRDLMKPVDILYCADTAATPESVLSYHTFDPRFRTPELVGKIGVPVLVVVGGADDTTPGLDKVFGPLIQPGKVEMVVVEGADHFFRDLYGEEVADAVVTFLGKP